MDVPIARADELTAAHRFYEPRGAALELMSCRAPEVLLSGPAGTGKTTSICEKLHLCAEKYPGMRGLIVRKTRESLTESVLVTFEEKVVPEGHPILNGPRRNQRQAYHYPNGSAIIVAGMRQAGRDQTQRVMSTDYDLIYVPEAIELNEDEWERLTTRLRNGRMPYSQLLADTNPDAPSHWLKKRCDAGRTLMLESRHEDNPSVTPEYLAKLDALTGARYQRLRRGIWCQAEGMVYEGWDPAIHVIDSFPIPREWPRYWSIDFGYKNPLVVQWWAEDPDGRLFLYREYYRVERLVEDAAADMVRLSGMELQNGYARPCGSDADPLPRAVICDHDAEDRATLKKHLGLDTVAAKKEKSPGLQAVASRLKRAGNGKPRLAVFRDALVQRDPILEESKKPCGLVEEITGYVWDLSNNRKKGEEPIDKDNHSCDAMRYMVAHLDLKAKQRAFTPYVQRDSMVYTPGSSVPRPAWTRGV